VLRWAFRAVLAAVLCLAAGCGNYQGVVEFQAYRTAFESTHATSTAILDQLAVKERELFMRTGGAFNPRKPGFNPDLARYYTDVGDPPGTGAIRRSLDTVKVYNDVLFGLSSGQTAEALTAKLAELTVKVGESISELDSLTGFASGLGMKPLLKFGLELDQEFTRLTPFVRTFFAYRSRDEFRQLLSQNHEHIRAILVQLRSGTTVIFPILSASSLRRWRNEGGGPLTADEAKTLDTYRKLLADWVILIEGSIKALDQAKLAAEAPPTIGGAITGLTTVAVELQVASQAARRRLAELSK
jgi:hypothetical protein